MSTFVLKPEQIKRGYLTAQDFSDYAGYPVTTAYLEDFPFWPELDRTHRLNTLQKLGRQISIYRRIKPATPAPFRTLKAWKFAGKMTCCLEPAICSLGYANMKIERTGEILSASSNQPLEKTRPVLLTTEYGEDFPCSISLHSSAAIVLKYRGNRADEKFEDAWSWHTGIRPDRIIPRPHNGLFKLLADIHEAAHLIQPDIRPHSATQRYYREVSAEDNLFTTFKHAEVGQETLKAQKHSRYTSKIHTEPLYYIGPALDALEAQKPLPLYRNVYTAVEEIRLRLVMAAAGQTQNISSDSLQASVAQFSSEETTQATVPALSPVEVAMLSKGYTTWMQSAFPVTPEHFFTLLREVRDKKAFTEPLSRSIADKMIEGAEHFGGKDLTHAPNVRQKIKLPDIQLG